MKSNTRSKNVSTFEFRMELKITTLLPTSKKASKRIEIRLCYAFFLVCCGCDTSYIVLVHIKFQASIYKLSLCRGHSWRVRLAKQETLTPPGHLVSRLVCRGQWMSTVVLYCWCHSDSSSVLLYFTHLEWNQQLPTITTLLPKCFKTTVLHSFFFFAFAF